MADAFELNGWAPRRLRNGLSQVVRELGQGAIAWLLLLVPTRAIAEVCDKSVGESWRTEDGPVWLLNPVGFPFALTICLGGLLLVAVARLPWLGYFMSILLLFTAVVAVFADLMPEHDIYLAQIREGCRSRTTDFLSAIGFVVFAIAYFFIGYRAHRVKSTRLLSKGGLRANG